MINAFLFFFSAIDWVEEPEAKTVSGMSSALTMAFMAFNMVFTISCRSSD